MNSNPRHGFLVPIHDRQARRELASQWARIRKLIAQCHSWGWYNSAAMLRVQLRRVEFCWRQYRNCR